MKFITQISSCDVCNNLLTFCFFILSGFKCFLVNIASNNISRLNSSLWLNLDAKNHWQQCIFEQGAYRAVSIIVMDFFYYFTVPQGMYHFGQVVNSQVLSITVNWSMMVNWRWNPFLELDFIT